MDAIMQLNALFPTRDIGSDPVKVRDWAQAAEGLGYNYIEVPDHVFGATAREGWTPVYNEKDPFHETFVILGFLAARTGGARVMAGTLRVAFWGAIAMALTYGVGALFGATV